MDSKVKVIKKEEVAKREMEKARAEQSLMSVYLKEMALKYPEKLKKLLKQLNIETC